MHAQLEALFGAELSSATHLTSGSWWKLDTSVIYWKLLMVVADLNSMEQSITFTIMKRNRFDFECSMSNGSSSHHD
jgi:hypothetical protein